MIGPILGDIIGSVYEFLPTNNYTFTLFTPTSNYTDDTVCTIGVADAILHERTYVEAVHAWCRRYNRPKGGFGGSFMRWVASDNPKPYGSFGNGSAMRVSPVGWLFDNEADVLREAAASAAISHDHVEGIKGAQAVAYAILRARNGADIQTIIREVEARFGYEIMTNDLDRYRNKFDETCQGTIPPAFMCLAKAHDYESAIRFAVSLGADADTIGAIVGGIAEALWGVPETLRIRVFDYLPSDMIEVVKEFEKRVR